MKCVKKMCISWSVIISGYVQNEEAQVGLQVFREMVFEVGIEPDGITMMSLLKACASLGNLNIGRMVHRLVISKGFGFEVYMGNSLINMYSKLSGYFLALSMYASGGSFVDAARMRRLVKERGVRVVAGYSLVHVKNRACKFLAGDKSTPQVGEIHSIVDQLHGCMKIDESLLVIEC